jgi:hypothetical protein
MIQNTLCKEVLKHSQDIEIVNDVYIWKLVVSDNRVRGALGLDMYTGKIIVFPCKALVIATGGAGSSYKVTDMDTGATGDGYSLALDAGVELIAGSPSLSLRCPSRCLRSYCTANYTGLQAVIAVMVRVYVQTVPYIGRKSSRTFFPGHLHGNSRRKGTIHGGYGWTPQISRLGRSSGRSSTYI